jgi:hypothetical protein
MKLKDVVATGFCNLQTKTIQSIFITALKLDYSVSNQIF